METFKRWMVGLDFSATDEPLITYVAQLARLLRPQRIYFVHLRQSYEVPEAMKQYLPSGEVPTRESIRVELEALVRSHYTAPEDIVCEVYEGNSDFELWREAHLHSVDLFLAGSKPRAAGRGVLPQKFVRKSTCSICLVPENPPASLRKIMVPTDFSEDATRAMTTALSLAQPSEDCQLICLHVYELPHAYYYDQFPRQQYAELMERKAQQQYGQWIKAVDTKNISVEPLFRLLEYSYVAEHIQKEAEAQQADLLVMSAGSSSLLSRIFLGSETGRVVQMEKRLPVMIIKEKDLDVGLWDMITRRYT